MMLRVFCLVVRFCPSRVFAFACALFHLDVDLIVASHLIYVRAVSVGLVRNSSAYNGRDKTQFLLVASRLSTRARARIDCEIAPAYRYRVATDVFGCSVDR
jgi:hypothetical protein